MKLPARPPGTTDDEYHDLILFENQLAALHRQMSNERGLWQMCNQASCKRARRCHSDNAKLCFLAYAKVGGREIWDEFWARLQAGNSETLKQLKSPAARRGLR